jgi:hypothetical protein
MVAALIVIVVLGIALPAALWSISRWRLSRPETLGGFDRQDEIDTWLTSEFNLNGRDRVRVRRAVLPRRSTDLALLEPAPREPASLEPALVEPARGLAARVLADQFPRLRRSRRMGLVQLGMTAVYAGGGILVLAAGRGGDQALGVILLLDAGFAGITGVSIAVLGPRRTRRNAERVLQLLAPERPRTGELPRYGR